MSDALDQNRRLEAASLARAGEPAGVALSREGRDPLLTVSGQQNIRGRASGRQGHHRVPPRDLQQRLCEPGSPWVRRRAADEWRQDGQTRLLSREPVSIGRCQNNSRRARTKDPRTKQSVQRTVAIATCSSVLLGLGEHKRARWCRGANGKGEWGKGNWPRP
jgi:hypothetical protein